MLENSAIQPSTHPTVQVESIDTAGKTPAQSRLSQGGSPRKMFSKPWQKVLAVVLAVLAILGVSGGVIAAYTLSQVGRLQAQAKEAQQIGNNVYAQFKGQNLPGTESELKNLQAKVADVRQTYNKLSFYRFIPIANFYYADGIHGLNAADSGLNAAMKSLNAITPYADVLGFTGEGTFTGGTAEDRLKIVLETLDKVTPILDEITTDLKTVESELAAIDARRYPESVRGTAIRPQIEQVKTLSQGAVNAVTQYRPIIEQLPDIAGARGERKKYLILFTNDGELRATGGFLTAYSVIFIENGKVYPEKSDDIYELDKKIAKKQPIPEQLGRYLTTEKYFNLRDMNLYPDFKQSMELFLENYRTIKGEPQDIDGIIALDTHVLTDLLKVLGPVEVPGYGTFSAEPGGKDLPQVVYALSEIITRPTPYLRADRKGILGPMMRAILTKSYGAPKQQWPQLFELGIKSLEQRHAQMYFLDEKNQSAAEAINAAGRMVIAGDPDFLAIVNSNLGGAKSNFFITYDVKQEVSAPADGMIEKKVTITYKNSRQGDNCNLEAGLLCLNATNRDWTRIYVPKGSQLVEAQGFNQPARTSEEGGFTVFEGFFLLEPMGQSKLVLTYKVPYTNQETYRLQMWKQGGLDPIPVLIDVTGGEEELTLEKDTLFETKF